MAVLYPWYVACVLCLAQINSLLDRYLLSVVLESLKLDLQLTDSQLGLLQGASFVILFVIASIPLGRLADVWSRRMVIFIGIMFWSAATIAMGFSDSFTSLFVARLGIGLGEAALVPAAMSLLAAYFSKEKLSRGIAIFSIGGSLGRAAAFLGGGALFTYFAVHGGMHIIGIGHFKPWQALFIISGIVGLGVALLVLTIREPARPSENQGKRGFKEAIFYLWTNRPVYGRLFVVFGCVTGVVMILAAWTVSLYVRQHGLSIGRAAAMVGGASLIIGPLGGLFGGWLTDKLVARKIMAAPCLMLAAILTTAPFMGLAFFMSPGATWTLVAYCFGYFAISAAGPPGFGSIQMITLDRYRGTTSAIFLCFYTLIGFGTAPVLVGVVNDYVFPGIEALALSMFTSFAVIAAIGVPLALTARRRFQTLVDNNYSPDTTAH